MMLHRQLLTEESLDIENTPTLRNNRLNERSGTTKTYYNRGIIRNSRFCL